MKQQVKLLTKKQIINNPEKYIKFMCYNIFITIDNQVINLSLTKFLKEQLIGGSYCFYCNGKYRTKTWIRKNCVNVLGFIVTK
jgi:hypothetical protein